MKTSQTKRFFSLSQNTCRSHENNLSTIAFFLGHSEGRVPSEGYRYIVFRMTYNHSLNYILFGNSFFVCVEFVGIFFIFLKHSLRDTEKPKECCSRCTSGRLVEFYSTMMPIIAIRTTI